MTKPTVTDIMTWLEEVKDPEIPVLSLPDMGIIKEITLDENQVLVTITPTFVGCPAIDMIKQEIIALLRSKGLENIVVNVSFKHPWSSDAITEKGKQALKKFGLAPPLNTTLFPDLDVLEHAICPRCNGINTELKTPFGPTLCRSIHFCHDCLEAFEQFKPV